MSKVHDTGGFIGASYTYPNVPVILVTSGLGLFLDAGNSASYTGTGTTWTDLSNNNNNGTLVNGPTFSSLNNGSIVFDGVNDYVTLPTNLLKHETGNPFTFSIWFKTSSTGIILGQQESATPGGAGGYVPAIYVASNGTLNTSCFWGGDVNNRAATSSAVNDGNWKNITVTFSSGSHISYLNGSSYSTFTKTQTSYATNYNYFLGSGNAASWPNAPASAYLNGNIANILYYNRALSQNEITQNFNAFRGRYGI